MKRRVEQVDHLKKKKKRLDDSSFDEYDDEKSFVSSSQGTMFSVY